MTRTKSEELKIEEVEIYVNKINTGFNHLTDHVKSYPEFWTVERTHKVLEEIKMALRNFVNTRDQAVKPKTPFKL